MQEHHFTHSLLSIIMDGDGRMHQVVSVRNCHTNVGG